MRCNKFYDIRCTEKDVYFIHYPVSLCFFIIVGIPNKIAAIFPTPGALILTIEMQKKMRYHALN
jgi:hypothetical protein